MPALRFPLVGCVWNALLLAIFLLPSAATAQTLEGYVRGSDGAALPGANVYVPALQQGTVTDDDGWYQVTGLPAGTHIVEFRFVGFAAETDTITIDQGTTTLDVTLRPDTTELDEVLVTAEDQAAAMLQRASHSVSVLDAREMEKLRGQTLGETLDNLPGITTLSTGPSISKPVIRGLHSQRVVVVNAGVPQEGQQWGGEHAPEIDPFAPSRIEVVKGAAGVEYGIGAIGGAIRIEPAEVPSEVPVGGRLMVNGFSNNRQGAGSIFLEGGPRSLPGFGWRVQSSIRKAGDARTPDYVIGNSAFQEFDGSVALGYHTDRLGLHGYASHFGTELGLFSGAHIGNYDDLLRAIERGEPRVEYDFGYEIAPPKQTISHDMVTLKGHYRLPTGDWFEGQYGLQINDREEYDAHRRFGDPLDDPAFSLRLLTQTLDLKLRQRPRGALLGVVGVSGMNQSNVNGESGYLIPNFRALTGGVFARESWVQDGWTIEAGTRFDYRWLEAFPRERLSQGDFVRRTHSFASLTGVAGAIWQFSDHWSVAMNLGTAWRPPGVNELYNFGVHHGTAQFEIGNPSLDAERSFNGDVTLRHLSARSRIEVSVYNNRMQGYIYLFPEPEPTVTIRGTFPTFRYAQTDAVLRGLDGSVEYHLFDGFTLGAVASIVRGTDVPNDVPLIAMPADRLTLSTTIALPEAGFLRNGELDLRTRLVRRQTHFPQDVDYADPPPGYTLVGLGYRTELHVGTVPLHLNLSVENLFNTTYRDYLSRFRYFIDEPGRSIILRVQVPLGDPDLH